MKVEGTCPESRERQERNSLVYQQDTRPLLENVCCGPRIFANELYSASQHARDLLRYPGAALVESSRLLTNSAESLARYKTQIIPFVN